MPVAQRRLARRTSEFGTLYRGREGQWSWLAHRVTGVGIILFLFAHVVDTALVGWGPNAYNRVVAVYHNPFVRLLELALGGMVIYHALNGVRIMGIALLPGGNHFNRQMMYWTTLLVWLGMIPHTYLLPEP